MQVWCDETFTAYFDLNPAPDAPTNLHCEPDNYMHWCHNGDRDGFIVYEGDPVSGDPSCHDWEDVDLLSPSITKWCKPVAGGRETSCYYSYYITAYNEIGGTVYESGPSNVLTYWDGADCGGCPTYGCPYVYTWDGQTYNEDNTILRASDGCECSYTDYYKLEQPFVMDNDYYLLQIREFEQEHTYLDYAELRAVDHPAGVQIAVAPDGTVLPYVPTQTPCRCYDSRGRDRLDLVSAVDGEYFHGYEGDWLRVTFAEAGEAETNIISWVKMKAQLSSIAVEAPAETTWQYFAAVHPRENWSSHLTDISDHVPSQNLTFRFRWTAEHKLDYLTLAESVDCSLSVVTCPLVSAVHSTAGDVTDSVLYVDGDFAEVDSLEQIEFTFGFPGEPPTGFERSMVLFSTGFYEQDADKRPFGGPPQTVASSAENVGSLPVKLSVAPNYPNPFGSVTGIDYGLPRNATVTLRVYNARWQLVRQLVAEEEQAGYHRATWDGTDSRGRKVPNGLYFCQVRADGEAQTTRMVLLR